MWVYIVLVFLLLLVIGKIQEYYNQKRYKNIIIKKEKKRKEKIEFERMFKLEHLTIKRKYSIIYM